jgi:hypothetical protein
MVKSDKRPLFETSGRVEAKTLCVALAHETDDAHRFRADKL